MATLHTIKDKLPLMRTGSGHRLRNILVGIAYAFLLLTLIGMVMGPAPVEDNAGESESASDASDSEAAQAENNTTSSDGASDSNASAPEQSEQSDESEAQSAPEPPEEAEGNTEAAEAPVENTEENTQQAADEGESGPTPADMERVLISEAGVEVEVTETANGNLHANYYSQAANEEELASDIGAISGAYAAVVDGGHDSETLTIEVRTVAGERVGHYTVQASDAQAYMDGEISAEEFGMRVLNSGVVYE